MFFKTTIERWQDKLSNLARRYLPDPDADRARAYAYRIQRELDRMGISYRGKAKRGAYDVNVIELVKFIPPLVVLPLSVRLYVDMRHLPTRVKASDLTNQDVLDTISRALEKEVIVGDGSKFFYEIFSDSLIRGIPKHVWSDSFSMPPDVPDLTYPAGVGRRGIVLADLGAMTHFLVAGATRQGKSVHLWHLVLSLTMRNSPTKLKLVLVDLKDNAVTFAPLRNLPHLLFPLVESPEKCISAFHALKEEMERRYGIIGAQIDFDSYNRGRPESERMPHIVIVIDELASVTRIKAIFKQVEELLGELLRKSGGAGMHFVLATQYPTTGVLTQDVKANIPEAIAFRCAQHHHSSAIIGRAGAEKLSAKGRAILKVGADYTELQTPEVVGGSGAHSIYKLLGEIICKWESQSGVKKITNYEENVEQELIDYAVKFLGGKFNVLELFKAFRARGVTKKKIMLIGQKLEADGILSPGRPGRSRFVCSCSVSHQNDILPQGFNSTKQEQTCDKNNINKQK